MTETPDQPPPVPPSPPSFLAGKPAWFPYAIGAVVLAVIVILVFALRGPGGPPAEDAYTVEQYTPAQPLMTASEGVLGYEAPSTEAATAVMFGQGVQLNVTGRVARGIGNDWLAVSWNERTVFVRLQDAVNGDGSPPAPIVREEEPEEELPPEEEEENPFKPDEPEPEVRPSGMLEISDVDWIREPSARDFARYFPDQALEDGQSGRVVLDCVIGGSGRLDCSVAQESPGGYGFGRAALSIARQTRVQPTLPDGSAAAGRHLRLPLNFQAD